MRDKSLKFVVPVPERPVMVCVDPEQRVLMELSEEKPRELWLTQLQRDPHAIGRLRAARSVAKMFGSTPRVALAAALGSEPYWGMRVEIARHLRELAGDDVREALLAGARDENARVRAACVSALSTFAHEKPVADLLDTLVADGDASRRVEAEAVAALAESGSPDAVKRLLSVLDRESLESNLRDAVLTGLGGLNDPRVVDVLLKTCESDADVEARDAALEGLANFAGKYGLDESAQSRMLAVVQTSVESSSARRRMSAARVLASVVTTSADAAAVLRRLADDDSRWVRRVAEGGLRRLEGDRTGDDAGGSEGRRGRGRRGGDRGRGGARDGEARGDGGEMVQSLRDEIQSLRERNQKITRELGALRDQLEQFKARSRALDELLARRAANDAPAERSAARSDVAPGGSGSGAAVESRSAPEPVGAGN
jgi:aminopeptidase N